MFSQVHGSVATHQYLVAQEIAMQSVISLHQDRLTKIYLQNVRLARMDVFQNLPGANLKSRYEELNGLDRRPTVYLGKAAPGVGERGMGLAVIKEKIASDLYYYLGQNAFHIPESYLSYQLLNDPYTAPQIAEFPGVAFPLHTLRIMSRWIDNFHPLGSRRTMDDGEDRGVMEYIFRYHRPPETLRIPDDEWNMIPEAEWTNYRRDVPIYGLMYLLAVGRVLADTDVIGYDGGNVGIVWERDSEDRIIAAKAVKIDPGQSFNFAVKMERDLTILSRGQGVEYGDIHLDRLSENQKNEFRFALKKSLHLLKSCHTLRVLFIRDKTMTVETSSLEYLMVLFYHRLDYLRGLYRDLLV